MRQSHLAPRALKAAILGILAVLALGAAQGSLAQAARPCQKTTCIPTDTTAPSVGWTTPAAGATVSGTLWDAAGSGPSGPCEASASDVVGVSKVIFYVDTTQLNTDRTAPYNCKFDSTTVADGSHVLKAVAYDAAGNGASAQRTVTVSNAAPPAPSGRTLVFEDNFDGSAVNTNNWWVYNSVGHAGNGLRRPAAMSVANGLLTITGNWDGTNITSGGMGHRSNYLYGRFEARVRTEGDPSLQMSGVILTWPQSEVWPRDGELDFYETGHSTATRTPFYSYLHWMNATSGGEQTQIIQQADAREWHTMAMDWDPSAIRIYRDDVLIGQLTDPAKIPNVAHHMSVQLDAFSNRSLSAPVHMDVDWVKVYH